MPKLAVDITHNRKADEPHEATSRTAAGYRHHIFLHAFDSRFLLPPGTKAGVRLVHMVPGRHTHRSTGAFAALDPILNRVNYVTGYERTLTTVDGKRHFTTLGSFRCPGNYTKGGSHCTLKVHCNIHGD